MVPGTRGGPPAMSDPSERFTDLLPCGCSYEQGQWFHCAAHIPDLHSRHTAPVQGCILCESLLDEARALESEQPWNDYD